MSSYAIIGTGALGGYYGAKLQRAGLDVHFLVNSDYQQVKTSGLVIRSMVTLHYHQLMLTIDWWQIQTCEN